MDKLVELFCDVDDFCRIFIPQWEQQCIENGHRQRRRYGRMSVSEIMTILIFFICQITVISKHFIWDSFGNTTATIFRSYSVTPVLSGWLPLF